jgi:hypothetical protein
MAELLQLRAARRAPEPEHVVGTDVSDDDLF